MILSTTPPRELFPDPPKKYNATKEAVNVNVNNKKDE